MSVASVTMEKEIVRSKKISMGGIVWIFVKYASVIFCAFMAVLPIISCVITSLKTEENKCYDSA